MRSPCGHICYSCCHHARVGRDATKSDKVLCPPPSPSPRPHSRWPGCAGVWLRGCKVTLSSSNATRLFNHGEHICPHSRLGLDFLGERRAFVTSSPEQLHVAAVRYGASNRPLSGRHALQTENKQCKGTRLPYYRLEYLLVTYGPSCDTTSCVSVSS